MTEALPGPAAHLSNLAEFSITAGSFPASGAQISFVRKTPPPSGSFSVIVHWNEKDKTWEPVKTKQSEDRLTLTATVAHFSSYSVIDFFKDVGGVFTGGGMASVQKVINGTGQWLGVQAAPPTCENLARPEWAKVLGTTDISSIITSCMSGSIKHPDNLIVKVTINRSYGGYFSTPVTPVSASLDSSDVAGSPSAVADAATSDIEAKGYFDWKTVGAMMLNSGMMSPENETANIYPVMPFGTYTFEFTKEDILLAWPTIKSQNKQLISFDTNWQLALAGALSGVMDATVAATDYNNMEKKKKGEKEKFTYLITALQINDCLKTVGTILTALHLPSGDDLLSIYNCVTLATDEQILALSKRAGLGDVAAKYQKAVREAGKSLFAYVAGVEIGATVGTAINDLTAAKTDRHLYFKPGDSVEKIFDAAPWAWHTTSDHAYQFLIPSDWKVVPGPKPAYSVAGANESVVNDKGDDMSVFVSGAQLASDFVMYGLTQKTLDYAPVPKLKPVVNGSVNGLVFQGFKVADRPWGGTLSVNSYSASDLDHERGMGFVSSDSRPNSRMGGTFAHSINDSTVLADVSPDLTGMDKLTAYMGTTEYLKIKTMLTSLRNYTGDGG
ncbi:hypothetical protein IV500_06390 [Paeniglutamicibacter antarcticus]|uniref:Uncharacterized protein n=2 Tax=Arthrobacter terrae TaxID=2935737 RepID=A0A931CQA4_9MICC|nr:hypothetical protein [Arthrobacter terrae]